MNHRPQFGLSLTYIRDNIGGLEICRSIVEVYVDIMDPRYPSLMTS